MTPNEELLRLCDFVQWKAQLHVGTGSTETLYNIAEINTIIAALRARLERERSCK